MPTPTTDEQTNNELSQERRERVISRSDCGRAYRKAARLRDEADRLETEDTNM